MPRNGDVLLLNGDKIETVGEVPTDILGVDRKQLTSLGSQLIKNRKRIAYNCSVFISAFFDEKWQLEVSDFDEPAKRMLLEHSWPGNVRELKQVVQAAVVLSEGQCISSRYLKITPTLGPETMKVGRNSKKMQSLLQEEEQAEQQIRQAIAESNGNLTQAAALLGISRPTLYKKMNRYGISNQ